MKPTRRTAAQPGHRSYWSDRRFKPANPSLMSAVGRSTRCPMNKLSFLLFVRSGLQAYSQNVLAGDVAHALVRAASRLISTPGRAGRQYPVSFSTWPYSTVAKNSASIVSKKARCRRYSGTKRDGLGVGAHERGPSNVAGRQTCRYAWRLAASCRPPNR